MAEIYYHLGDAILIEVESAPDQLIGGIGNNDQNQQILGEDVD